MGTRALRPIAYGLEFAGRLVDDDLAALLPSDVAGRWPQVRLDWHPGRPAPPEVLEDRRAVLRSPLGGHVEVDRSAATAVLVGPRPSAASLAQPGLLPVATVLARWEGRSMLAGGAILGEAGAVAVCGGRGAGVTTLLAALARQGYPVLGDVMLALDGVDVLPGPRLLDLRPVAAGHLGARGLEVGPAGAERCRLLLGPVPLRSPLAAWVVVEAGRALRVTPLAPADRLANLAPYLHGRVARAEPIALLRLAARPGWLLRRPRTWHALPETVGALAGLAGPPAAGGGAGPQPGCGRTAYRRSG